MARSLHDCRNHARFAPSSKFLGYAKDAEKYLEAVLADWTVIRLTGKQLELDFIERIVSVVSARTNHSD